MFSALGPWSDDAPHRPAPILHLPADGEWQWCGQQATASLFCKVSALEQLVSRIYRLDGGIGLIFTSYAHHRTCSGWPSSASVRGSGALGHARAGSTRVPPRHVLAVFWTPRRFWAHWLVLADTQCPGSGVMVLRASHRGPRYPAPKSVACDADFQFAGGGWGRSAVRPPSPRWIRGKAHPRNRGRAACRQWSEREGVSPRCNPVKRVRHRYQ